jgi:CsoR family transcriptional regulator, copper-sensing transcriptional repressor
MPNDPILTQLKRIKGQLDGIIAMYENEQTCVDVVHQVIAARNSLGSVAQKLLFGEANRCTKERRVEDLNEILREVFRY